MLYKKLIFLCCIALINYKIYGIDPVDLVNTNDAFELFSKNPTRENYDKFSDLYLKIEETSGKEKLKVPLVLQEKKIEALVKMAEVEPRMSNYILPQLNEIWAKIANEFEPNLKLEKERLSVNTIKNFEKQINAYKKALGSLFYAIQESRDEIVKYNLFLIDFMLKNNLIQQAREIMKQIKDIYNLKEQIRLEMDTLSEDVEKKVKEIEVRLIPRRRMFPPKEFTQDLSSNLQKLKEALNNLSTQLRRTVE